MSVKGKRKDEWVARTLTNFGDPTRKEVLRNHFTERAAYRAWEDILKIYGREGDRVWQETRDGQTINDSSWS
jgi:hypothetical protein